jgi:methionine-rich copper-binding protein CopC
MTFDVGERVTANRKRLTRNTVRAAAGLTTLVVTTALIAHAHGRHNQPDSQSHSFVAVPSLTATDDGLNTGRPAAASKSTANAFVAPARRVVLPAGAARVDGYPVGFPHTPEGAAALAVALGRYVATLDYASADEVTHLYMDPALTSDAAKAASALVRDERQQLGIPVAGPVADGYSISRSAFGVQWRVVSTDVFDVTVIGSTDTNGKAGHLRRVVAGLTRVKWFSGAGPVGDWRAVHATGASAPTGIGEIGSKAFNDSGYAAIEQAQP